MLEDIEVETIWMNGAFIDWDDAQIHALSHAANFGTGVFDATRCYDTVEGPAIFQHRPHVERLADSAKIFGIELGLAVEEYMEIARELIRRNDLDSAFLKYNVSYGYHALGLDVRDSPVDRLVAAVPMGAYLGEEALTKGIRAQISPFRRVHSSQFPTQLKAMGPYIMATLARSRAIQDGYDEAIMLDVEGNVAEGSGENIFIVDDGTVYTPGVDASILPGITRKSVIQLARDLGYEVVEKRITTGELYSADEAFFTGNAAEITPIRDVDRVTITEDGRGPVTEEIQSAFFEVVEGRRPEYYDWLDFV